VRERERECRREERRGDIKAQKVTPGRTIKPSVPI